MSTPYSEASLASAVREFAIIFQQHGAFAVPHTVCIGPVVWGIDPGHDERHWYIIIADSDADGDFRASQLKVCNPASRYAVLARDMLMLELLSNPKLVVHDFEDEYDMIELCEQLWPCPDISRVRGLMERDRALRK